MTNCEGPDDGDVWEQEKDKMKTSRLTRLYCEVTSVEPKSVSGNI